MSEADRIKWQQRYATGSYKKNNPIKLLVDWIGQIPVGKALDIACGAGRNSVLMAQAGFQVDAIDISSAGIADGKRKADALGLKVNWIEQDLDQEFKFARDYDLIVVMWYVNLELITQLCDCLEAGGYLLCEEHLITDQAVIGPRGTDYRVAADDLRRAVSKLEVLYYAESVEDTPQGESVASARVVARKSDSPLQG